MFATGFVGMKLWNWFVAGIFDLPQLTILKALGISILVRVFTYENIFAGNDAAEVRPTSEKTGRYIIIIVYPWICLLLGYIVHKLI